MYLALRDHFALLEEKHPFFLHRVERLSRRLELPF